MIKINHFFKGKKVDTIEGVTVTLNSDTKGAHAVIAKKEQEQDGSQSIKRQDLSRTAI